MSLGVRVPGCGRGTCELELFGSGLPVRCNAVPSPLLQMNRPIQVKPADSESRGGSSCLRQPPSREGPLVSDLPFLLLPSLLVPLLRLPASSSSCCSPSERKAKDVALNG